MNMSWFHALVEEGKSIKELAILSLPFKRLWNKASKTGVILAVIFSVVEAALYTINPAVLRHLIDTLNKGYNFGWGLPAPIALPFSQVATCEVTVLWLAGVLVVCSILWYATFNLSTGFARNATYLSQVTFGTEAYRHILNLDMDFHIQSRKGEVLAKTDQAIREAQDFLYNSFFSNFLRAALSILMVLSVIYTMDIWLFAICAATLGLGVYTNLVFGSRVSKEEKAAWRNVTDVQARSLDVMGNVRETKIFGNEAFEAERRQLHAEQQLVPLKRITLLWRQLTTAENLWQNLGFALAMFLVVLPGVFAHKFTAGQVAQFIGYYLMLFTYFIDILFKYLNAQRLVPKLKDLQELLLREPSVKELVNAIVFPGLREGIEFTDVSFAYPNVKGNGTRGEGTEVLHRIQLTIPKGQVTALVGRTGCGKTTLVNLLMRLYDPSTGNVQADGMDVRCYQVRDYRQTFAVLSQDAYLFNASVAFNIAYSRVGASRAQVLEAARVAQAHEFISRLPQGYDTLISERAANISGGQKQRIALARAVLANDADVIILDEPTTGLDPKTSGEFLDELMRVFAGKTMVVVTHDRAIMDRADQVVFMEQGHISSVGKHTELIASSKNYQTMLAA